MDITTLKESYRNGITSPAAVVREIYARIRGEGLRPTWISLVEEARNLERAEALGSDPEARKLPLFGVPFAVKDNFDVAGMETTAGCPRYAREAQESATVVQRLLDAGAILIGKTNMDQFATGLVGTRTPYGICSSVFNEEYVSGGSSSGSAIAVANGLVSFSLGTDTAGSGRVPAAFNQLVGMKPTRGLVSTYGLLPACRTLDCVSIFAETCLDASLVLSVLQGYDSRDPYSRAARVGEGANPWTASKFRFGIPTKEGREFFGDREAEELYDAATTALIRAGGEPVLFDYKPFYEVASLLYSGPWVAERLAAIEDFASEHADEMDATVRQIVFGARRFSAVDAFRAEYKFAELLGTICAVMDAVDVLLLPTTGTTYRIDEVLGNPVQLNTNLGHYTNFVNLLDLAAVAVPSGFRGNGLPFGVSLIGKAFTDKGLLALSDRLHRQLAITLGGSERLLADAPPIEIGSPEGCVLMAVVGAHLTGQPLNWQLTQRKARLVRTIRTVPDYKLYALPNTTPAKPGLVFTPGKPGPGIELEVWAMPEDTVGSFLVGIPAPLSLGTVHLEDGTSVKGFLCEPCGIVGAEDITHLGGWRAYMQELKLRKSG